MWSFSMCFYIEEKKSDSSKQYSNLPYIDRSDTVSGDEWFECVFAWEGDWSVLVTRSAYVFENLYTSMY